MAEATDRRRVRAENNGERPRRPRDTAPATPATPAAKESLQDIVMRTRQKIQDTRSSYFKPKDGQNRVRILPSHKGVGQQFYVETPLHQEVGPNKKWCTCLEFWGERCPICRAVEKLAASESARDQNAASKMMVVNKYLVNVGVPNKEDGLVKPWSISSSWFYEILGYFGDPEYGDFTHPREGYDYIFTREGSGMQTRYTNKRFARDPSPVKIAECKKKIINLDTFPKRFTRQEMLGFLRGEDSDD